MKRLSVFVMIFIFALPAYAEQVSFAEAKAYLDNTVQLHKPEDKSIDSEAYDYPAIDIVPLWQKLGIEFKPLEEGQSSYVFDYRPGQKECFLSYPKTDVLENGDIKIIRITKSTPWDHQYLFFKYNGDEYYYFGHLEYAFQKYEEPELTFLENDLIAVKILSASGTGTIAYRTILFQIVDGRLKELLSFMTKHERWGWGLCFDETVDSRQRYENKTLTIDYEIGVFMNDYYYKSKIKGELSNKPIVFAEKRVVLTRKPEGLVLDKERSNATTEDIEDLYFAGFDVYYKAFKSDFDALAKSDPKTREWLEFFMKELEDSKKADPEN